MLSAFVTLRTCPNEFQNRQRPAPKVLVGSLCRVNFSCIYPCKFVTEVYISLRWHARATVCVACAWGPEVLLHEDLTVLVGHEIRTKFRFPSFCLDFRNMLTPLLGDFAVYLQLSTQTRSVNTCFRPRTAETAAHNCGIQLVNFH